MNEKWIYLAVHVNIDSKPLGENSEENTGILELFVPLRLGIAKKQLVRICFRINYLDPYIRFQYSSYLHNKEYTEESF